MLDAIFYLVTSIFSIEAMQLIFFLAVIFLFGAFPANEEEWSRIARIKNRPSVYDQSLQTPRLPADGISSFLAFQFPVGKEIKKQLWNAFGQRL